MPPLCEGLILDWSERKWPGRYFNRIQATTRLALAKLRRREPSALVHSFRVLSRQRRGLHGNERKVRWSQLSCRYLKCLLVPLGVLSLSHLACRSPALVSVSDFLSLSCSGHAVSSTLVSRCSPALFHCFQLLIHFTLRKCISMCTLICLLVVCPSPYHNILDLSLDIIPYSHSLICRGIHRYQEHWWFWEPVRILQGHDVKPLVIYISS